MLSLEQFTQKLKSINLHTFGDFSIDDEDNVKVVWYKYEDYINENEVISLILHINGFTFSYWENYNFQELSDDDIKTIYSEIKTIIQNEIERLQNILKNML